ncbi:hypothetical protein FQN57_005681 [Myotisia sp. PD_48]|nr:hypothetical protein FQN57_005681 [Myotisia sp. PD_48]
MAYIEVSDGFTADEFEFENDTLQSIKHLPFNKREQDPPKGVSRHQYTRDGGLDLDYAIDTSALRDAFPEFSNPSDSDDGDDDISIEIGRGDGGSPRRDEHSIVSNISLENSQYVESPSRHSHKQTHSSNDYGTRPALRNISNRGMKIRDNLRRDAQIRRASIVAQKENVDPNIVKPRKNRDTGSRPDSSKQRRTLSDIHARVAETYDGSYISDERPADHKHRTTKNTRFSSNQIAAAIDKASGRNYSERSHSNSDAAPRVDNRHSCNNTITNHDSFIYPDNLSELVSGIFQDDTQVKYRPSRLRNTRFASPPVAPVEKRRSVDHRVLNAVHVPEDEKVIFEALKLLQAKVATLEQSNLDAENHIRALEQENIALQREERREEEYARKMHAHEPREAGRDRGIATLAVEKNSKQEPIPQNLYFNPFSKTVSLGLQAANLSLENQLSLANQHISAHEATLKKAIKDRDALMNQLGACSHCQNLQAENNSLRHEKHELQSQLEALTRNQDDLYHTLSAQDDMTQTFRHHRMQRDPEAGGRHQNVLEKMKENRRKENIAHVQAEMEATNTSLVDEDARYSQFFDLSIPREYAVLQRKANKKSQAKSQKPSENKKPNTGKQRMKKLPLDEDFENENTGINITTQPDNITLLSFFDPKEMAALRKQLEEERIVRKQSQKSDSKSHRDRDQQTKIAPPMNINDNHPAPVTLMQPAKQKKPEQVSGQPSKSNTNLPEQHHAAPPYLLFDLAEDEPQHQRHSLDEAQHNKNHSHECQDCSVCKRIVKGECARHEQQASTQVPTIIPLSSRKSKCPDQNQDHTVRPSQPPSIALGTILKGIEDELSHLKLDLAEHQDYYHQHDAALGKRQRKSIFKKIQLLMRAIEEKSDQIYALYDVVEAQNGGNAFGDGIPEQGIEQTLQSLGIGAATTTEQKIDLTGCLSRDEAYREDTEEQLVADQSMDWGEEDEEVEHGDDMCTEVSLPAMKIVQRHR